MVKVHDPINIWDFVMKMDVINTIKIRRSIREFSDEPVPQELIERILDSARYAPSGENSQLWRFVIVKDEESKKLIADLSQHRARVTFGQVPFEVEQERLWYIPKDVRPDVLERTCDGSLFRYAEQADTCIICSYSHTYQDAPIANTAYESIVAALAMAIQNMWLTATALGLGAGFLVMPCVTDGRLEEILSDFFGFPRSWRAFEVLCIGVPRSKRHIGPSRFPLESICFTERWGMPYKRKAFAELEDEK